MAIDDGDIAQELVARMVAEREPPNRLIGELLAARPGMAGEEVVLALLQAAVRLEEMYDELGRDEWNDWQRVDYWRRIATRDEERGGGAGLLALLFELYRAIALIAADMIRLRRAGVEPVTARDLLRLWREMPAGYF